MCTITAESVSYLIRIGIFAGLLALLPWSIVPFSAYLAFFLTMVLYLAPASFPPLTSCLSSGVEFFWPTFSGLLYESAVGLLLAAIVGAVGFGALFVAKFVQQIVIGFQIGERDDQVWSSVYLDYRDSLQTLVLLVFLYLVFAGPEQSYASVIYSLLHLSYMNVPPLSELPLSWWGGATEVLIGIGTEALVFVAFVGLPLFFASLFVDLAFVLVSLTVSEYGRPNFISSLKMPALLLFMAVAIYPFTKYTGQMLSESFEPSRIEALSAPENFSQQPNKPGSF